MIIRPDGAAGFVQGGNSFGTTGTLGTNDAQNLVFETGGTEKIRIQNSDGYVAIGSGTPLQKLHVIAGDILVDNNKSYIALDSGGSGWEVAKITASDVMQFGPNGAFNNPMTFYTNGGERMRITAAGDVGIGTTTPGIQTTAGRTFSTIVGSTGGGIYEMGTAQADADDVRVGGIQYSDSNSVAADKRVAFIGSALSGTTSNNRGGLIDFYTKADGASGLVARMVIDNAGNVGIGTTTPEIPLHVFHATTDTIARFESGDTKARIQLKDDADDVYLTADGTAGVFSLGFNSAISSGNLNIDTSGNVGIGTAAPSSLVHEAQDGDVTITHILERSSASIGAPQLNFYKSRGTLASKTIVASGDNIFNIVAAGYDGASFLSGVQLLATVDGTPGSTDMPTRFTIGTTPDGGSAPTERFRIDNAGNVLIGTTAKIHTTYSGRTLSMINGSGAGDAGVLELGQQRVLADAQIVSDLSTVATDNTSGFRLSIIRTVAKGATANNRGGEIQFFTKPDAGAIAQRMAIDDNGEVNIGLGSGFYFGGTTEADAWRIKASGANLLIQKYESSVWVTKQTILA